MADSIKYFRTRQKGFTLIELLVVIGILGTLSAVAVPNVIKFIGSGKTEAAMAEQHNVQVAVTAYAVDHSGGVPANMTAITPYLMNTPEFTWTLNGYAVIPGTGNPLTP
jgi:type IV pilus assembly protein PilA